MLKRILILTMLGFQTNQACSQQDDDTPKNYPGVYTSLVFDNISTAVGIEFERYLFERGKFAWAARAGYLFKYKWGNANIISGANDNVSSSNWQLWTSGYWFTSYEKNREGFFINGGLGLTYTNSEESVMISPPAYTIIKGEGLSPAIEAGVGFQFNINRGLAIRLGGSGAVFFPAKEDRSFSPRNTLSFRVAVGF